MALNKVHKQFDSKERYEERNDNSNEKYRYLAACGGEAAEDELQYLESRCAKHNGNCHKKGEFGTRRARDAREHSTENGRARARGAGDKREHLKCAYFQRVGIGEVVNRVGAEAAFALQFFDENKCDTVSNKSNRNRNVIVEVGIEDIVKKHADHGGRQSSDYDLEP